MYPLISNLIPVPLQYHCATSQKAAGSIPDGVIGIFHWRNPSGHTMTLELTQTLTEMSTRSILGDKGGRCIGLTILPPSCADCLEIWEPQPPGTLRGLSRPVMGLLYLLPFYLCNIEFIWKNLQLRRNPYQVAIKTVSNLIVSHYFKRKLWFLIILYSSKQQGTNACHTVYWSIN